jgi:transcriptional regulator with XRE-family HTH domain
MLEIQQAGSVPNKSLNPTCIGVVRSGADKDASSDDPDNQRRLVSLSEKKHDGVEKGGTEMDVGEQLKQFRELKGLSQVEIEERTGLVRCYISRVENGHTVPSLETLEKFARALDMPLYQLLYEKEVLSQSPKTRAQEMDDWASRGKGRRIFLRLQKAIQKMSVQDRALLLHMAARIVSKNRRT